MSAITNSPFSSSSRDVVNLEVKGRKSGGGKGSEGSEGSGGSKGNRPDTIRSLEPKNQPTPAPFVPIIWEIKPNKENTMHIDSSGEAAGMSAGKSLVSETDEVSAARQRVLGWSYAKTSMCDKAKARGSSSSGKSGPVTYDGGKCLAAGSSSDVGYKSTAVYSPSGSANNSCSIS